MMDRYKAIILLVVMFLLPASLTQAATALTGSGQGRLPRSTTATVTTLLPAPPRMFDSAGNGATTFTAADRTNRWMILAGAGISVAATTDSAGITFTIANTITDYVSTGSLGGQDWHLALGNGVTTQTGLVSIRAATSGTLAQIGIGSDATSRAVLTMGVSSAVATDAEVATLRSNTETSLALKLNISTALTSWGLTATDAELLTLRNDTNTSLALKLNAATALTSWGLTATTAWVNATFATIAQWGLLKSTAETSIALKQDAATAATDAELAAHERIRRIGNGTSSGTIGTNNDQLTVRGGTNATVDYSSSSGHNVFTVNSTGGGGGEALPDYWTQTEGALETSPPAQVLRLEGRLHLAGSSSTINLTTGHQKILGSLSGMTKVAIGAASTNPYALGTFVEAGQTTEAVMRTGNVGRMLAGFGTGAFVFTARDVTNNVEAEYGTILSAARFGATSNHPVVCEVNTSAKWYTGTDGHMHLFNNLAEVDNIYTTGTYTKVLLVDPTASSSTAWMDTNLDVEGGGAFGNGLSVTNTTNLYGGAVAWAGLTVDSNDLMISGSNPRLRVIASVTHILGWPAANFTKADFNCVASYASININNTTTSLWLAPQLTSGTIVSAIRARVYTYKDTGAGHHATAALSVWTIDPATGGQTEIGYDIDRNLNAESTVICSGLGRTIDDNDYLICEVRLFRLTGTDVAEFHTLEIQTSEVVYGDTAP